MKSTSFDTFMYSDPEHMIFAYSPRVKHLRLLELEKCSQSGKQYTENEYGQNLQINSAFQEQSQWVFRPKRCFLLDEQMATIQKQQQGRPISYHKQYNKLYDKQLQTKIFNWYSQRQSILLDHRLTQQYYSYSQLNSFCFGRKHFVRAINAIELASDHISRNHCEILVAKGRATQQIRKYFDLLFGVNFDERKGRLPNKKIKISRGNKLMLIPIQLWQKIYQYIFLTRDKYYMLDNGSRNGSFFIQCPLAKEQSQQQSRNQSTSNGNRIDISHRLQIREGFSYQYQGEEYLMKVWRLTNDKIKLTQEDQHHFSSQQNLNKIYPLYIHNRKTIKNVQEFEQKINWFNNFQKVSKDYIIDQLLLKRNLWKGKKVYQDMIRQNFNKGKRKNVTRREQINRQNQQLDENQAQEDNEQANETRPNESYQPFVLLPPNPTSPQTEYITKAEFVRLIYQEYVLMQKIFKRNNNKEKLLNGEVKKQYPKSIKQQQVLKEQSDNLEFLEQQCKQFFINQHKLSTIVISLDFSNDFKKLYCMITQVDRGKKFHIGSQMIINTARFQFDEHNKCNGYIQFNGRGWYIAALRKRNDMVRKKVRSCRSLTDSEDSEEESEKQKEIEIENEKQRDKEQEEVKNIREEEMSFFSTRPKHKSNQNTSKDPIKVQKKQGKKIDLSKQLSNKIWTKIPSMSQYQLNPQKCSRYIMRMAHSFYFELKFINFTQDSQRDD